MFLFNGLSWLCFLVTYISDATLPYIDARRASMIRHKMPGPYVDIMGPTVLTVILMMSIVAQFSIKLYTLM